MKGKNDFPSRLGSDGTSKYFRMQNPLDFENPGGFICPSKLCRIRLYQMEDRANQNSHNTDRSYIFDNNCKDFLSFKGRRKFDFIRQGFGLDDPANENAGKESYDWHHNAVADVIEEIQERHTENGNVRPNAHTKRTGNTDEERTNSHYNAGKMTVPFELILQNGNHGLHQRNGRSQRCKKH